MTDGRVPGIEFFDNEVELEMIAGLRPELAFERRFDAELLNFKDAKLGVDGDSVIAAMICRRDHRYDLLEQLHRREVTTIGEVDYDAMSADDLMFVTISGPGFARQIKSPQGKQRKNFCNSH